MTEIEGEGGRTLTGPFYFLSLLSPHIQSFHTNYEKFTPAVLLSSTCLVVWRQRPHSLPSCSKLVLCTIVQLPAS